MCRRRHVDRLEEQPRPMQRDAEPGRLLGAWWPARRRWLPPRRLPCLARHIACATKVEFSQSTFSVGSLKVCKGVCSADFMELCRDPSPSSSAAPAAPSEPQRDAAPSTAPSTAAAPAPSAAPLSAEAAKNKVGNQALFNLTQADLAR